MTPLSVTRAGIFLLACVLAITTGWIAPAGAQVTLASPTLPPESDPPDPRCDQVQSLYTGPGGVHAAWPGPIVLSDPIHSCFRSVTRTVSGADEIEDFTSVLRGVVDAGSGPVPVELTGPVTTLVTGKAGNTTGTFSTEIVAMSLTGDFGGVPIEIRESPSQVSPGQTSITDIGGGQWQIDSFFDVFTEISVNGGPFLPQTGGALRMSLVPNTPVAVEETAWENVKQLFR